MNIKKILVGLSSLAIVFPMLAIATPTLAVTCTPTGFFRDGIDLKAAQIGGNVSGTLDATGCDIGVYYGPSSTATVNSADIFGARYYGVVNQGGAVDVTSSEIHNIGNNPFDGSQHGVAVYYASVDNGSVSVQPSCDPTKSTTGTIDGNTVSSYQKGGIVAACANTTVNVTNNTVTGNGPVDYIAQNGIEVAYGATASTLTGNTVSGNIYTQGAEKGVVSTGVLFYQGNYSGLNANQILPTIERNNTVFRNQANVTVIQ